MTNQNTSKAESEKHLEAFMDSEVTQYVDWVEGTGKDAKKHHDKIIVEDPGIEYATQAVDFLNVGDDETDWEGMMQIAADHVLLEPEVSFDQLNNDLPEKDHQKVITKQNKDGDDVNIKMVFPGYRKAISIVLGVSSGSGRSRIAQTLATMNEEVFRQADGQIATMDYWNAGGAASGLGMVAYNAALDYLSEIITRDGLLSKLTAAYRFLVSTVRQ